LLRKKLRMAQPIKAESNPYFIKRVISRSHFSQL